MPTGYKDAVFYSRSGRGLTLCGIAIGGLVVFGCFTNQGLVAGFISSTAVAVVSLGLYVSLWRPRLEVNNSGIVIVNPFSTHRLDWSAIRSADMRWVLIVSTGSSKIAVWAVPRQSRGFEALGMRVDPFKLPDYEAQKQHEQQDFGTRADNAALHVIQSRLKSH